MTNADTRRVICQMMFPDAALVRRLLDSLSHRPGLDLTLVRARVTRGPSWCEVQIRGAATQVERALRICQRCGVAIREMDGHECPI